jgi:putative salt-induced outer membrane protein YdiY
MINFSVFFTVLLFFYSFQAKALINIEDLRQSSKNIGFYGESELSVSGKTGNKNSREVSIGSHLGYKKKDTDDFLIISVGYEKNDGVLSEKNYEFHLRHVHAYSRDNVYWEMFAQRSGDDFRALSSRDLLGGGLRLGQKTGDDGRRFYGFGVFYEEEKLLDNHTSHLLRINSYFDFRKKLRENVTLSSVTYFQPDSSRMRDFRFLEKAKIEVSISNHMGFYLELEVRHDSEPPLNVKKTDVQYTNGLTYEF